MGDARSARLSVHAEKLDADYKQRYADKVALCVDSLILTSKEAAFDIELVPKVELPDIKDYLEPLLKSHGDCAVVPSKVNHSQELTTQPLEPWLLVKKDGAVKTAHCTCMAGLGEARSCIGALFFYLEAAANFHDSQACTDKDKEWLPPHLNRVPFLPLSHIDFTSVATKKRRLYEHEAPPSKKKALVIEKRSQSEWTEFLDSVKEAGTQSAELAVTEGYTADCIPISVKYSSALLGQMARDKPPSWDAVVAECNVFAQAFVVKPKVTHAIFHHDHSVKHMIQAIRGLKILRLFETKEAASQPSKRVPLPPRPSDSDDDGADVSESSGDSLHEVFRKAADRCAKVKSEEAFRSNHLQSLFEKKVFFRHYLEKRCSDSELMKRHNMLGKLVAGKIADLMKQKK
ncbi:hypothetical protein HPB52_022137 [Rhipicephalus sanguineus]|uniref:Uncharacterized protein n=1 Tax=Rhipicephalus sanguineus TaxID=34632 RepID=A0A9D4TBS7_RHISA|nr:hypothetical protein HPB52_022137 [Rhipicephalus sanguineus]